MIMGSEFSKNVAIPQYKSVSQVKLILVQSSTLKEQIQIAKSDATVSLDQECFPVIN